MSVLAAGCTFPFCGPGFSFLEDVGFWLDCAPYSLSLSQLLGLLGYIFLRICLSYAGHFMYWHESICCSASITPGVYRLNQKDDGFDYPGLHGEDLISGRRCSLYSCIIQLISVKKKKQLFCPTLRILSLLSLPSWITISQFCWDFNNKMLSVALTFFLLSCKAVLFLAAFIPIVFLSPDNLAFNSYQSLEATWT